MKVIPPQTHMNTRHVIVNGINGIQGSGWAEASMHGSLKKYLGQSHQYIFFQLWKINVTPRIWPKVGRLCCTRTPLSASLLSSIHTCKVKRSLYINVFCAICCLFPCASIITLKGWLKKKNQLLHIYLNTVGSFFFFNVENLLFLVHF